MSPGDVGPLRQAPTPGHLVRVPALSSLPLEISGSARIGVLYAKRACEESTKRREFSLSQL